MGNISYLRKLCALDPKEILGRALSQPEIQSKIIELNQDQLFEQGIQADNTVTGSYSPMTVRMKQAMGQRTDHITLSDTGEFYESMKVEVNEDKAVITGDTEKDDQDLIDRWPKALGLTEDSLNDVMPLVIGGMMKEIKKAI